MIKYSYPNHVLVHNPKAYWRFEEPAGNFVDESGNQHTGIANGGITYGVAGGLAQLDRAITLDGSTGFILSAGHDDFALGDGPFTLEYGIKKALNGTDMTFVSKGIGAYQLRVASDNKLELLRENTLSIVKSTITITDTEWHRVVATKGGATSLLYIDGVDVTGTVTDSTMVDTGDDLYMGRRAAAADEWFNGSLDEGAIYNNYVMPPAEVLAHYEARLWLPPSPDPARIRVSFGSRPPTLLRMIAEDLHRSEQVQVQ